MDLVDQINLFRRLHQSSDVSPSEELDKEAGAWAQQLAAEGAEKIDPSSKYGQLVCSHHAGSDLPKACAVKWYSAIKFFDWADPKLTVKSSPFTQMVWKNSTRVGVGIAQGGGGAKRRNIGGKYFIAAFFDPAQSDEGNIKENVLPAAGQLRSALLRFVSSLYTHFITVNLMIDICFLKCIAFSLFPLRAIIIFLSYSLSTCCQLLLLLITSRIAEFLVFSITVQIL